MTRHVDGYLGYPIYATLRYNTILGYSRGLQYATIHYPR